MIAFKRNITIVIAIAICGLCLLFAGFHIYLADQRKIESIQITDFCHQFYFAGHMAANGAGGDLYLPVGATEILGSPPDTYAHKILPVFEKNYILPFLYTPVVALLVSPYSRLGLRQALLAWQATSILALLLSCFFASLSQSRFNRLKCTAVLFFSAFLFFVVTQTIVIGQVPIIFGLLPMSIASYFLVKKRYVAAGLSYALMFLKPQLLLPILVIMAVKAVPDKGRETKPFRTCFAALTFGCALLSLISCQVAGWNWLGRWYTTLKLAANAMQSNIYYYYAQMISLGGSLLMTAPQAATGTIRLVTGLLGIILTIAFALFCRRVERANLEESEKLSYQISLGFLLLPLTVPYLRLYDLTMLLLPLWLLIFNAGNSKFNKVLSTLAIALTIWLDWYYLCLQSSPGVTQLNWAKLILLAILSALIFLIHEKFKEREREKLSEQ